MLPVAKVVCRQEEYIWLLLVPDNTTEMLWISYPYLAQINNLTAIMYEVGKDPKPFLAKLTLWHGG